jgi:thiol:disulfide interchange protein
MVAGVLRLVQLCCCGLLAGAWIADRVALAPVRSVITASTLIIVQQGIQAQLRGVLPVLIVALVAGVGALLLLRRERWKTRYVSMALGTLGLLVTLVVVRIGNTPIDTELMNWTPNAPPENLRELWQPWERASTLRTLIAGASFILLCLSAVLPSSTAAITSPVPGERA